MRTFAKKPKAAQKTTSAKSPKLSRSFVGQGRDINSILHLQRMIGNQAVLRLLQTATENIDANSASSTSTGVFHDFSRIRVCPGKRNTIQPKLKVNAPQDRYEQEANRVADQVFRQKTPDENYEKVNIQAKPSQLAVGGERDVSEHLENQLNRSRGRGSPLPNTSQSFFEERMQHDFSKVSVHTDNESAQMNQELKARAFTHGRDIYFGAGQYNTQTTVGKRLLAHELTHVVQQNSGRNANAVHRTPGFIQRDVVTFEEGTTVVAQPLGPHLYNEIRSGLTVEPAPGVSIGYWYRIYEVRAGVDINRLYADLEILYGYGRFTNLTRPLAAYLGTRITPRVDRFFALYPNRRSREPIGLTRLQNLRLGLAEPREVAQPGITAGFTERREEAWTALAPTARVYINDWADWSLRGLDRFLGEIPMQEDRSVQNALSVFGNVAWALTSFIPVVGPIARAVVGGISLVGALTASLASIAPGTDLSTARKRAIRGVQENEITRVADGLEQQDRLSPILITVLVKAQERGMAASERDALLWNHMFDIPYTTADRGRRARILQRAYSALRRSWGVHIR